MKEGVKSIGVWFVLGFVRFYQIFLGPFFGGACKFYPSCSKYAYEAIERHGVRRGLVLALKRLGRCRPFTKGGFDPVPDVSEFDGAAGKLREGAKIREKQFIPQYGNFGRESRGETFTKIPQGESVANVAQGGQERAQ